MFSFLDHINSSSWDYHQTFQIPMTQLTTKDYGSSKIQSFLLLLLPGKCTICLMPHTITRFLCLLHTHQEILCEANPLKLVNSHRYNLAPEFLQREDAAQTRDGFLSPKKNTKAKTLKQHLTQERRPTRARRKKSTWYVDLVPPDSCKRHKSTVYIDTRSKMQTKLKTKNLEIYPKRRYK